MEVERSIRSMFCAGAIGILLVSLWSVPSSYGQLGANRQAPDSQGQNDHPNDTLFGSDKHAEDELNQGTQLTSKGAFKDAIPHLLAAQGRVANQYAAGFNLALCYVATNQFKPAIKTLNELVIEGHNNADVQ